MTNETFNMLLDELDGNSLKTLKEKNAKYASSDNCLHNFDCGAEIMGSTPAQCAWGYMTKHLTSLRDKIKNNDFHDREDFLEKCQDIINYIRFIWLLGNDERSKYTRECCEKSNASSSEINECDYYSQGYCTAMRYNCQHFNDGYCKLI